MQEKTEKNDKLNVGGLELITKARFNEQKSKEIIRTGKKITNDEFMNQLLEEHEKK